MSALGSLVVTLALEYAEYTKGIAASDQAALKFAQNSQRSFDKAEKSAKQYFNSVVSNAALAVSAYVSVHAAISRLDSSINTLARLDDMAQKTGSSIENLSRIQKVVTAFGGDFEAVDKAIAKLAKGMATLDSPTNKVNSALKSLGVSSRNALGELRDPSEVMIEAARKLDTYRDSANKTALATDLFSKAGAEQLPVMNDIAEHIGMFAATSTEAAQRGTLLKDEMGKMRVRVDELFTSMALNLMPALTNITSAMGNTTVGTTSFTGAAVAAGTALKALVILGASVAFAFEVMGRGLGGYAAQFDRLIHLDFKAIPQIGQMMSEDNAAGLASFKKFVSEVLNGTQQMAAAADKIKSPVVKPALNYTSGAAAANGTANDKVVAEYDKLISAIREKTAAQELELSGEKKITAGQKMAMDMMIGLRDSKIKLTDAMRENIAVELQNMLVQEQAGIAMQAAKKGADDMTDASDKQVMTMRTQLDNQREQNALYGLTNAQILSLVGAKDLELAANMRNAAMMMEGGDLQKGYMVYANNLETLVGLQKQLVEEQQIAKAGEDWSRMWSQMEQTGRMAFVQFAAHGSSAVKSIMEATKLAFFDLIYQIGKQQIMLRVGTSLTGGLPGTSGGGVMDSLFNAAGLMNAGKMLWSGFSGGLASGMSMFTSGIGSLIGSTALTSLGAGMATTATGAAAMTGAAGLWGAGAGVGGLAGMGASMAAMAGPLAAVAAALFAMKGLNGDKALFGLKGWAGTLALGLLPAMFGLGPKKVIGQGIEGEFGADGFQGQSYVDTLRKGGWFRGNRQEQERTDFDFNATEKMNTAMALLRSSTTEYANVLSLPVDKIAGYTAKIKVALTGDAAGDKKAIDDMFLGIADSLANLTGNFSAFIQEGETAATIIKRLATEFIAVDNAMHTIGMRFTEVGLSSMAAREGLIAVSGGLEAMQTKASYFAANFLTDGRRFVLASVDVLRVMASLGHAEIKTKAQFANLVQGIVEGGHLMTEAGRATYAALMNVQEAFAAIADTVTRVREDNLAAANDRVAAARDALTSAYDNEASALQSLIEVRRNDSKELLAYRDSLLSGDLSTASPETKYAMAGTQLDNVYSLYKAGVTDAQSLQKAAQAFLESSKGYNATGAAFGIDFDKVQSILAASAVSASKQSNIAQEQLTALQASVMGQINLSNNILSVRDAVLSLRSATAFQAGAATQLADATSGTVGTSEDKQFINGLYSRLLNRAPDAAGEAGWLAQIASGASPQSIVNGFLGSQEYISSHATGGVGNGWAMAGEQGPELVRFKNPGRVYTASQTRDALGNNNKDITNEIRKMVVTLSEELQADKTQRAAIAAEAAGKLDTMSIRIEAMNRTLSRQSA